MARIAALHGRLQLTLTLLLAALLLWSLFCAARGRLGRGLLAGLWVAELLLAAQALLGALLLAGGAAVAGLHLVYGVVALLALPLAISYVGGRTGRWEALTLALACLFLLGVLLRATVTAT